MRLSTDSYLISTALFPPPSRASNTPREPLMNLTSPDLRPDSVPGIHHSPLSVLIHWTVCGIPLTSCPVFSKRLPQKRVYRHIFEFITTVVKS